MNELLLSAFLEELVYESDEGCHVHTIFHRLVERNFTVDSYVEESIFPLIRTHPQILFIAKNSTFQNIIPLEESTVVPDGGTLHHEVSEFQGSSEFKIVASVDLRIKVLDLANRPDVSKSSLHLRLLSAIASKRYQGKPLVLEIFVVYYRPEGISQMELCRLFKNDPKWLFQNMKPLYKYDLIIRRQITISSTHSKDRGLTNSSFFWLKRFFDPERFPEELLQSLQHLYQTPLTTKILEVLRSVATGVVLETDFRALCLQTFFEHGNAELFTSKNAAIREYGKLKQNLIESKKIALVQAWCPQRNIMCDSISLYDVARRDKTASDEMAEQFALPQNISKTEQEQTTVQPGSALLNDVAFNDMAMSQPPGDRLVHQIFMVYELPICEQVLCLINMMPDKGVLSTEISAIFGITPKRMTRLLQNLESVNLVFRSGQRLGKHFIYKYFPKSSSPIEAKIASNTTSPKGDSGSVEQGAPEKGSPVISFSDPSVALISKPKLYTPKTQTKQFKERLGWVKETLDEYKACSLPLFIRKIGQMERNNGPDRRTVLRLLDHAMFEDSRIQKTSARLSGTDQMRVYYISTAISVEDALIKVSTSMNERRSEIMRDSLRNKSSSVRKGKEMAGTEEFRSSESRVCCVGEASSTPTAGTEVVQMTAKAKCSEKLSNLSHANAGLLNKTRESFLPHLLVNPCHLKGSKFSQAVLGHYGFIFPLMIRLKVFHTHLMDIIFHDVASHCDPQASRDNNEESLLGQVNTLDLLKKMSIEAYFRTIGCGYRHVYLDKILENTSDITVFHRVQDLPASISRLLLYSNYRGWKVKEGNPNTSRMSAVVSAERLLHKLAVMKCVVLKSHMTYTESNEPSRLASRANHCAVWQILPRVTLEPFFTSTPSIEHIRVGETRHFDLTVNQQLESFWRCFKDQVEQWSFAMKYPKAWKSTSFGNHFDYLFHFNNQPTMAVKPSESSTEEHPSDSLLTRPFHVPDNMPLTVAFCKKNWTAKLLLSPASRVELHEFALSLLHRYKTKSRRSDMEPMDVVFGKSHEEDPETPSEPSPKNPLLLTSQSPCIQRLSQKLNIPSHVILRYLSRFFNPKLDSSFTSLPFTIYTGRDARYFCHLCGTVYFQKPSWLQHYKLVHQQSMAEFSPSFLEQCKIMSSPDTLQGLTPGNNLTTAPRKSFYGGGHTVEVFYKICEASTANDGHVPPDEQSSLDKGKATDAMLMEPGELDVFESSISTLKRDEVLVFLSFAVISQRLYKAMPLFCSSTEHFYFFDRKDTFPGVQHHVWVIMSQLFPPTSLFYNSPAKCHNAFVFLVNRYPSMARRILRSYSRCTSLSFEQSLHRLTISSLSSHHNFIEQPVSFFWYLAHRSDSPRDLVKPNVLEKNCLKILLLSSLPCYRSYWAIEIARHVNTEAMTELIDHWSQQNWIVKAKSNVDRWTPLQRAMDVKCRRKYYMSNATVHHLFKKSKDFILTRDLLFSSWQMREKDSHFVIEPCQPVSLCCLLEEMSKETIRLEIGWENMNERDNAIDDVIVADLTQEALQSKMEDRISTGDPFNMVNDLDRIDPGMELMTLLLRDAKQNNDNVDFHSLLDDGDNSFSDQLSVMPWDKSSQESGFPDRDLIHLTNKQHVVTRAIEGGLEKHIKELTPNVKSIWDCTVLYSRNTTDSLFLSETIHSQTSTQSKENAIPSVKIFLPCERVLHRLGCTRKYDSPDPLFFSNITLTCFVHHSLAHGIHFERCSQEEEEKEETHLFGCDVVMPVPLYEDDVAASWTWGEMTCETKYLLGENLFVRPNHNTPGWRVLHSWIIAFFGTEDSPIKSTHKSVRSSLISSQDFVNHCFNQKMDASMCGKMEMVSLLDQLTTLFPCFPKVDLCNLSHLDAYAMLFVVLTNMPENTYWQDVVWDWPRMCLATFHETLSSACVIDALFYVIDRVNQTQQGVSEKVLKSDFVEYLRKKQFVFVKVEMQDSPLNPSAFLDYLLFGLEMLRIIVRFPAEHEWIFVASTYAALYCIPKRRLLGVQLMEFDETHHVLMTGNCCYPIFSLGGLDEALQSLIPKALWFLWGPPSECHWNALVDAYKAERLCPFLSCLTEFHLILLFLRTFFLCLKIADCTVTLTPLPSSVTPCCGWIQVDGHLNATLVAFFVHYLYFLCDAFPGATRDEIFSHTPPFFRCETIYLLNLLCKEKILYTQKYKELGNITQYFRVTPTEELFL